MEPLVSVMLCSYNGAAHIKETIESILNQTYQNFELIIVDDASKDETQELIREFQDGRIKFIPLTENQNICNAGNVAFKEANGKYGALIGHDDIWLADKLQKQVHYMEQHTECDCCFTWADIIDGKQKKVNEKYQDLSDRFHSLNCTRKEWVQKLITGGNYFCAPSALMRMDILKKVGGYRYGLVQLQDYDLWLRILACAPVSIIEENLTLYRRFEDEKKNLSSENAETFARRTNEQHYSLDHFIGELSTETFKELFAEQLCNPAANTEAEILCEKALLRIRYGNGMGQYRLLELVEDEVCRKALHDRYGLTLQDIYRNNVSEIFMSPAVKKRIEDQNELIEKYRQLIGQLKNR